MAQGQGYIIEFVKIGEYVKVTAADPQTLIETSVAMPARGVTKEYMTRTAIRKLERLIEANNSGAR